MGIKIRPNPRFQTLLNDGTPAALGKLYTYIPGTTDDKAAYQDKDGATPHTNPIVLDANGEAVIWWNGVYDLKLTDADDVQQWTLANFGEGEDTTTYGNYNLVSDGGFEDDSNGDTLPDQWTVTAYPTAGSGAGTAVIDATDQIEGLNSLKFTSQGDGGGYAESAYIEAFGSAVYWVSFYIKSSAADVLNKVEVLWYTSAKTPISTSTVYSNSATNPTSWTLKTGYAGSPATARYAKIRVTGCHSSDPTTGSTWFDSVFMQQYDAGPFIPRAGATGIATLGMSANIIFDNNYAVLGDTTVGGQNRNLIKMNASNIIEMGHSSHEALLNLANYLRIGTLASIVRNATGVFVVQGAYHNGTNWIALDTTADIMALTNGGVSYYHDTGLTVTNSFTPTAVFVIGTTGLDYSSSYLTKKPTFVTDSDSPVISETAFDIDAAIGAAWESVGPTGGGKTNTWTALDSVPTDADWIEVRITQVCATTGVTSSADVYARPNGSAHAVDTATLVARAYVNVDGNGTNNIGVASLDTAKINVSSRSFDLYTTGTGSAQQSMVLVGYGYN